MKNYYQVLGLNESATFDEVRQAYLKYANKFHPDKHHDDVFFKERFQEIQEAYEYIKAHQKTSNSKEEYNQVKEENNHVNRKNDEVDLYTEAINYYNEHEIEILNQYGFFNQKKKRQASIIWGACLISMAIAFFFALVLIGYLGADCSSPLAIIIYIITLLLGYLPGMYIGPAIMGVRDKTQFKTLEENVKRQFVKDYIKEHSK